jgi:ATP-dependent protease HslVU (ClpYQ) peptidase subunit
MTTIVGIKSKTNVCLVADKQSNYGNTRIANDANKLIILNEGSPQETAIAVAGLTSVTVALRALLPTMPVGWTDELSIHKNLVELQRVLKADWHLLPEDDDFVGMESMHVELLIANRWGLWRVTGDRSVFSASLSSCSNLQLAAIGSGSQYAMGSLATYPVCYPRADHYNVVNHAQEALRVASLYDNCTGYYKNATVWSLSYET